MLTLGTKGNTPDSEIRCVVGLIPKIPQRLAGTRVEPAQSVPIEKSTKPQATAEAEPLDEHRVSAQVLWDL